MDTLDDSVDPQELHAEADDDGLQFAVIGTAGETMKVTVVQPLKTPVGASLAAETILAGQVIVIDVNIKSGIVFVDCSLAGCLQSNANV